MTAHPHPRWWLEFQNAFWTEMRDQTFPDQQVDCPKEDVAYALQKAFDSVQHLDPFLQGPIE